jgi:predicted transcriptional regulator
MKSPPPDLPRPTESELPILRVLWTKGPSTVRDVMATLEPTRPMGYTTVLKFMQIMHDKGLLARDESARSHVYAPAVAPEKTKRQLAGHLVEGVFGGSVRDLVVGALGGKKVSPEEIAEIHELLESYDGKERV